MTGDDSYHAHCFKCKVCKTRIDELVFAKTSQGIYCMNCHNERMAKIRRHAQKKKERERAGDSSKSRERSAKEFGVCIPRYTKAVHTDDSGQQLSPRPEGSFSADNSMRSQASATPSRNDRSMGDRSVSDRSMDRSRQNSQSPLVSERDRISPGSPRNAPKQPNQPLVSDAFEPQTLIPPTPTAISITPETPPRGQRPAKPLSVSVAAQKNGDYSISSDTPSPSRARFQEQSVTPTNSTGDHPGSSTPSEFLQPNKQGGSSSLQRKKSYDDGMRPLNVLYQQKSRQNSGDQSEGLSVPSNGSTSRSDKRRSFIHEVNAGSSTHKLSPTSPRSPTFSQSLHPDSRSDSPLTPSPTREQFPTTSSPRSMSPQINSARNSASTTFHSMGTSSDQGTDITNARTRSASSSTYLPERSPSGDARPPLRPSVTMDQVPRDRARLSADGSAFSYGRGSPTLGPPNGHAVRLQKSFDDGQRAGSPLGDQRSSPNSNSGGGRPTSGSRSRPTSDSRRADVPHSIESGTDTEAEKEEPRQSTDSNGPPPAPPPKEPGTRPSYLDLRGAREQDASMAAETTMQVESANTSEDPEESSPVESTSVATFIAPALPPIRFSMTGADFSDMLKNVGGMPSLKALDHLAKLTEESSSDSTPPTPPSSSALPVTPSTDRTAVNGKMTAAPQNKIRRKPLPGSSEGRTSADESRPSPAAFERVASESTPRRPHTADSTTRSRSSSDGQAALTGRPSIGSNSNHGHITITAPDSNIARPIATDTSDLVVRRLQEAFADANERGAQQLKLDKGFVEAILTAFDHRKEAFLHLKVKYDGMRRASQHYEEGLTVAQTEYDRELKARRDADAEVTRLRVLLSGQAARLTMISGEVKKQEVRQQLSQERTENVDELERDLSKLQVERDMALAEVEELSATKQSPTYADGEVPAAKLGRSLTMRLDNIKKQYEHELIPLTQQREALNREIADLKAARDMFLEETTVLNARNEELAQLSAQYARRMDASNNNDQQPPSRSEAQAAIMEKKSGSFDRTRTHPAPPNMQHSISSSSNVSSTVVADDSNSTYGKPSKGLPDISSPPTLRAGKFKWPGSKPRDLISSAAISDHKPPGRLEHTFQQLSVLRFTRCDHCGDKMWGSQLRCSGEYISLYCQWWRLTSCIGCNLSVHVRCINHVQVGCSNHPSSGRSEPQAHIAPLRKLAFGQFRAV